VGLWTCESQNATADVLVVIDAGDPEAVRQDLEDPDTITAIVESAGAQGVVIVSESVVLVEEPTQTPDPWEVTPEDLHFWNKEWWTSDWAPWKITLVTCVGALLLLILLWVILDCCCFACCCGKICKCCLCGKKQGSRSQRSRSIRGGSAGMCGCCCSPKKSRNRSWASGADYEFSANAAPDERYRETELPERTPNPMYTANLDESGEARMSNNRGRRVSSISSISDGDIDDITDSGSELSLGSTNKSSSVHQAPVQPVIMRQLSNSNQDTGSPIRRMVSMPSSYTESAVPGPEEFSQAPVEERMPNHGSSTRQSNFVPPPRHSRMAEEQDDRYLPSGSDYEYTDDEGDLTDSESQFSLDHEKLV